MRSIHARPVEKKPIEKGWRTQELLPKMPIQMESPKFHKRNLDQWEANSRTYHKAVTNGFSLQVLPTHVKLDVSKKLQRTRKHV